MTRSTLNKISYASLSLSAALTLQFFQSKAQFFYITEMKISPLYYGFAIGLWSIWNSINDPLAGWIMDRKPTRYGRRFPWIVAFWIPLVISFGLIWSPPEAYIGRDLELFIWLTVVLVIFDTSYTVLILAWTALFPEIFPNHKDRNLVSGLRQVFSLIALVLALVVPPFFINDNDVPSYAKFGWILAVVTFINVGFALYGSREDHDFSQFNDDYSLKDGIMIVLHNRSYQAFLIANLITYFSYGQVLAWLPFYRKYILNQDEGFETIVYGVVIFVTLFALAFWIWFTNRKDSRTTYIYSTIIFSVFLIPIWFVKSVIAIIILMGFMGFGLAGLLMIVDVLISEVIDEDFIENGKRREGIFFGFNGFFIRIAILLQAITLVIVSKLTGFNKDAEVQSELAKNGIKMQFILFPIIGFLIGIFVMSKYYGIYGDKLKKQRETIAKLTNN